MRRPESIAKRAARRWILVSFAGLIGVLGANSFAQSSSNPQLRIITLARGETRVIDHLKAGATPVLKPIENPRAIIVHTEIPGEMVLMGAERGRWEIGVQFDDGSSALYDVTVESVAKPGSPTAAGASSAATALGDIFDSPMGSDSGGAASSPIDAGAGPVTDSFAANGAADPNANPAAIKSLTTLISTAESPGASPPQSPGAHNAPGQIASLMVGGKFQTDPPVRARAGAPNGSGPHYLPEDDISIMAGGSEVIDFPRKLRRISIADSTIADVEVVNPFQLNVVGHKPGFTTLALWDEQGHYEQRQVRIDPGGKQQVLLNTVVAELDRTALENQGINYSAALTNYGVTLFGLPGLVATPYTQQASSSGTTVPATILPPGGSIMPLLLSQNVTYGLAAQNTNVLTQTLFQFLEQHDLGRILAQPRLLANSGEEAKFLSGGEIPIVIAQALNTSVVFKQYGTSVVFVPTVVGASEIELLVKPEVSEPDYAHGVELFGFQVPAFITRRAETMVRMQADQTLIIAGLILSEKKETVQKVPYLGDLPYAGALFRNTNWQDTKTDLVMAVTPQIVRALPEGAQVFVPSDRGGIRAEDIRTREISPPDAARPRF